MGTLVMLYSSFSDVPKSIKAVGVVNQEKDTAVLELGDMFDGGGVPIDHYIIQVDKPVFIHTFVHNM